MDESLAVLLWMSGIASCFLMSEEYVLHREIGPSIESVSEYGLKNIYLCLSYNPTVNRIVLISSLLHL